jgi:uncharacterized protein
MPKVDQARAWYDAADPVHGFDHVLRVLRLAEALAAEVGADVEIVRAAALLHDAAGAHPAEPGGRPSHEHSSSEFAGQVLGAEGWPAERIAAVQHCIRSHRYRSSERPASLEAQVLYDADKLDVMGAFGAARTIGYAVQAGAPVYAEPSAHFEATGECEAGEAHSAYHEYRYKLRHVGSSLCTEPARHLAEKRHAAMTAFFEQLAAEARGEA